MDHALDVLMEPVTPAPGNEDRMIAETFVLYSLFLARHLDYQTPACMLPIRDVVT